LPRLLFRAEERVRQVSDLDARRDARRLINPFNTANDAVIDQALSP